MGSAPFRQVENPAAAELDRAGDLFQGRGDEPGFDKNNVAVYGLGLNGGGDPSGQTEWSYLTNTTGWSHTDKNPWGTHYNYDDPKF